MPKPDLVPLPVVRDQTYALMSLAETMLADGRPFLLGDAPALPDCALYDPVWFIRQQVGPTASPLYRLPRILAWAERMTAAGKGGSRRELAGADALAIAKAARPRADQRCRRRSQWIEGRPDLERHARRHRPRAGDRQPGRPDG